MFAILGATGKVGSATIRALRSAGKPVRAILREPSKAGMFEALGCEVAVADLQDSNALAQALNGADAAQVMFPPAPRADDAGGQMRRSIESITCALATAKPRLALAISDYGAQIERGTGITGLFHVLEAALRQLPCDAVFLRSAEHMENWARVIPMAVDTGRLPSLHHPLTKRFPTISAPDLGRIAADVLMLNEDGSGVGTRVIHAEGPDRYTPTDVARALSILLQREIQAFEVPRQSWHQAMLGAGLSDSSARLVTELYDAHNRGLIDVEPDVGDVLHGTTDLLTALRAVLHPAYPTLEETGSPRQAQK